MMENVKWLIQKNGVFIIELLVIVIACVIVLKGPKQDNAGEENIEEIRAQKAEVPVNHMEGIDADEIDGDEIDIGNITAKSSDSQAPVTQERKVCLFTEEEKKNIYSYLIRIRDSLKGVQQNEKNI